MSVVDGQVAPKLQEEADDPQRPGEAASVHGRVPAEAPDVGVGPEVQEGGRDFAFPRVRGDKERGLAHGVE